MAGKPEAGKGTPKTNWRKDLVTDEMIAAIGKPRSGERIGQYFMRWSRHCDQESLAKLQKSFADLRKTDAET